MLNFADNIDADGGTILVPRFHNKLRQWCDDNAHLRKPLPWVSLLPEDENPLLDEATRVTMKEVRSSSQMTHNNKTSNELQGSVLIWNQMLMHGTSPNYSTNCRLAQYLKAYSRRAVFGADGGAARLYRRSRSLANLLRANDSLECVTPLGATLFGLDVLGLHNEELIM